MAQKLMIHIPDNLVIDAAEAAPILTALSRGVLMVKEGWQAAAEWRVSKERPTVELVDESKFLPLEEPIKVLTKEKEAADSRWYKQYVETQEIRKERDELKKKLEAIEKTAGANG